MIVNLSLESSQRLCCGRVYSSGRSWVCRADSGSLGGRRRNTGGRRSLGRKKSDLQNETPPSKPDIPTLISCSNKKVRLKVTIAGLTIRKKWAWPPYLLVGAEGEVAGEDAWLALTCKREKLETSSVKATIWASVRYSELITGTKHSI